MKKLLALAIVALMAGGALAQPGMGLFFSSDSFTDVDTNYNPAAMEQFAMYLVAIDVPFQTVTGYEIGITNNAAAGQLLVVSSEVPAGQQNFGDDWNRLCGFGAEGNPLPEVDPSNNTIILVTYTLLYFGTDPIEFTIGQATPPSVAEWDGPLIVDGAFPDNLQVCFADGGATPGVVATVNGGGVTPVNDASWTGVKNLFQ